MAACLVRWGAVGGGAFALACVIVAGDPALGPWDLLWITLLFGCLAVVLQLVWRSSRAERRERSRARELAARQPGEVAARAVVGERVRLAVDVEAVVRRSVQRMAAGGGVAAEAWDGDPGPALQAVQEEGRAAGTELRRLLGLLREAESPPQEAVTGPARSPIRARDVVLTAAVVALAALERVMYGDLREHGLPGADTLASLLLTLLAAATLVLRRSAPGAGATLAGLLFLAGAGLGAPVTGGFWLLATVGGLAWAASSRGGRPAAGAVLLFGTVTLAHVWRWPDNAVFAALIAGVPTLAGLLAACADRRGRRARARAAARAAELAAAAEEAVRRERLAVARDLHDVVSHAVGVMVVQAAAAAALRPLDPVRARAALDVVQRTAEDSLTELDRMLAVIRDGAMGSRLREGGTAERGSADLQALVGRLAAAGLAADLRIEGALSGEPGTAVYRIVQESLTNVLRHAPGARARVVVRTVEDGTTVEILDDGPGPSAAPRRGYGLVGIAERVQRLGGELSTGPGPQGRGFRVAARLPAARRPELEARP